MEKLVTHCGYENIPAGHPHVQRFPDEACPVCGDTSCLTACNDPDTEIKECWRCGSEFLPDGDILFDGTET